MYAHCILVLAATSIFSRALSAPSNHVVHEKREQDPKSWVKRSELDHRTSLPMRIGLTQKNLEVGHELLMEVSHPNSAKYGQYYSPEQIIDIFAPSRDSVEAVSDWLWSSGIEEGRISESANKQWIQFDAKVDEVERLLKTKYYLYEHVVTGKTNVACDYYHVPAHVQKHVDYITPALKLSAGGKGSSGKPMTKPNDKQKRSFRSGGSETFLLPIFGQNLTGILHNMTVAQELAECSTFITPPCIMAMYNITQATRANPNNRLGIFEEGGHTDFYAPEDLVEFFATLAPNIPITTRPILEGIDGGSAPGAFATGESDLDFQISYPIIHPQNSILFQTDDFFYSTGIEASSGFLNTFLDALDGSYCTSSAFGETGDASIDPVYPDPNPLGYEGQLQCGVYKPTNVISISYGEQEDDLPTSYQQRQCAEFQKLGMQGVSVVLASGDSGVAARGTDDGNADGCLGDGSLFNPDFPATCPYLTAAGATFLPNGASAQQDQEVAVTRFPSGGGFSNIYPRPSYQDAFVNNYFADHTPPYPYYSISGTNNPTAAMTNGGIYNRAGRGYPDVSAVGDNIVIFNNGAPTLIGGTFASAPVFASILNRINEERLAVGKTSIGFVNPTIYANPQVFHDITIGNNSGCGTDGFQVTQGWDPVTGLGTPNCPALFSLFMSML